MTFTTDRARQSKEVGELVTRLAKATAGIEFVAATGKVKKGEKVLWTFTSHVDLVQGVRAHLTKHGIALQTSTRIIDWRQRPVTDSVGAPTGQTRDHMVAVELTVVLRHGEQWIESAHQNVGVEDGKGFAVNKAITGALKYWMRSTFLVATGDDQENDASQPQRATQGSASRETQQRQPQQAMPSRDVLEALKGAAQVLVDIRAFLDVDEAHASLKRAAYHMAGRDPAAMTTGHVNEALAAIQEERLG